MNIITPAVLNNQILEYINPYIGVSEIVVTDGISSTIKVHKFPIKNTPFEHFLPLLKHNVQLCGGFFKNFVYGVPVKDIDIWFLSEADRLEFQTVLEKSGSYMLIYDSPNSRGYKSITGDITLDLIKKYGDIPQLISAFDFIVSMVGMRLDENMLHLYSDMATYSDILNKKLNYNVNHKFDPADVNGILDRAMRYASYGYSLSKDGKTKLVDFIRSAALPDQQYTEENTAGSKVQNSNSIPLTFQNDLFDDIFKP